MARKECDDEKFLNAEELAAGDEKWADAIKAAFQRDVRSIPVSH